MNRMEQQDQWAAWNVWADSRIAKFFAENPFTETQSGVLVEVIAELRGYTREYVDQKLGELRAEIEVLRGVAKNNNIELIKRSKDVP